ncbi:MAG: DUF3336 domain-containing protein [bacterium]|nr:DUF3336 domain-containing protein [bacterium]
MSRIQTRALDRQMAAAETFEEWSDLAREHDEATGMDRWRSRDHTRLYDYEAIRERLDRLRELRIQGDDHGLLFALNEGIHGNMGGMGSPKLHGRAKSGTKKLVEAYVDEIVDALRYLAELESDEVDEAEKIDFFYRANHCFGRTALMLSGGGTMGFVHVGVVKALFEQGMLPRVISGASAGSLIAGIIGTKTDAELSEFFDPARLAEEAHEDTDIMEQTAEGRVGTIGVDSIRAMIERMIPDETFQEAYERTGRQISISVAPSELHQTSRLLNAITSPNVYVRSAVQASCAVPGVYPPVTLHAKNVHGESQPYLPSRRWVDGSMSDDLPAKRLARLYGTNHTIVSLVNPVVLPFVRRVSEMNQFASGLARLGLEISREFLNYQRHQLARFPRATTLNAMVAGLNGLVGQTYSGDINIIARAPFVDPRRYLGALTEDEMISLIKSGERSTWPHMNAIGVATRISRTLDHILERYELAGPIPRAARRRSKRGPRPATGSQAA